MAHLIAFGSFDCNCRWTPWTNGIMGPSPCLVSYGHEHSSTAFCANILHSFCVCIRVYIYYMYICSFNFISCDSNCPSFLASMAIRKKVWCPQQYILSWFSRTKPVYCVTHSGLWTPFCLGKIRLQIINPPVPRLAHQKHREQLTTEVELQAMMSPWQHPLYIQRVWCVFEFSHAIMENKVGSGFAVRVSRALLPGICSHVRVWFPVMTGFLRTLHSVFLADGFHSLGTRCLPSCKPWHWWQELSVLMPPDETTDFASVFFFICFL